ncbi:hypothetical protein N9E48_06555 [Paracoccaceae bacterium]|nr:hypothetical protein [Paracoccaceae bacterium]
MSVNQPFLFTAVVVKLAICDLPTAQAAKSAIAPVALNKGCCVSKSTA